MSDPLSQQDPTVLAELEASIRADLYAGLPLGQITASLEKAGWSHEEAAAAVARVEAARLLGIAEVQDKYAARRQELADGRRGGAWNKIITGIVLIAAGVGITVVTYAAAAHGGVYVIGSGLFVAGAIRLLIGLSDRHAK